MALNNAVSITISLPFLTLFHIFETLASPSAVAVKLLFFIYLTPLRFFPPSLFTIPHYVLYPFPLSLGPDFTLQPCHRRPSRLKPLSLLLSDPFAFPHYPLQPFTNPHLVRRPLTTQPRPAAAICINSMLGDLSRHSVAGKYISPG